MCDLSSICVSFSAVTVSVDFLFEGLDNITATHMNYKCRILKRTSSTLICVITTCCRLIACSQGSWQVILPQYNLFLRNVLEMNLPFYILLTNLCPVKVCPLLPILFLLLQCWWHENPFPSFYRAYRPAGLIRHCSSACSTSEALVFSHGGVLGIPC